MRTEDAVPLRLPGGGLQGIFKRGAGGGREGGSAAARLTVVRKGGLTRGWDKGTG